MGKTAKIVIFLNLLLIQVNCLSSPLPNVKFKPKSRSSSGRYGGYDNETVLLLYLLAFFGAALVTILTIICYYCYK